MAHKSELLIVKNEIDNSVKYIKSRKEKITTDEVMQELGHIKSIVRNLIEGSNKLCGK